MYVTIFWFPQQYLPQLFTFSLCVTWYRKRGTRVVYIWNPLFMLLLETSETDVIWWCDIPPKNAMFTELSRPMDAYMCPWIRRPLILIIPWLATNQYLTNAGLLCFQLLFLKLQQTSYEKEHLNMSSVTRRILTFCLKLLMTMIPENRNWLASWRLRCPTATSKTACYL